MTDTFRLTDEIKAAVARLQSEKIEKFKRRVSVGDLLTERGDNAKLYGFGEGTTMYDNVLVLGDVKVGKNCWIGPNVILDGSGTAPYEKANTTIGSFVFIGPNSVIAKGVTIGDRVAVGALSFVNKDIPSGMKAFGQPARVTGTSS